jgi:hypothetical protein
LREGEFLEFVKAILICGVGINEKILEIGRVAIEFWHWLEK